MEKSNELLQAFSAFLHPSVTTPVRMRGTLKTLFVAEFRAMFLLSKWYCDCVSDGGDAFVAYWARLSWGPIAIPYSALGWRHPGAMPS
jgi:hypothetical protein